MTANKQLPILLALIALSLILSACGSDPVAYEDIPIYEGAAVVEPGQSEFADLVADLMSDASTTEEATADVDLYRAPSGMIWDDLLAFYNDALAETDWEPDETLNQSNEAVSMAGWTRGSGTNEQALLVGHTSDPLSLDEFIIVVLLTE